MGIAAGAGKIYWEVLVEQRFGRFDREVPDDRLRRAPTTIARPDSPLGLAVDASGIYWVAGNANGSVFHCPITGCGAGPEVLADNQNAPFSLVLDQSFIYWTNSGDGRVMALAKP